MLIPTRILRASWSSTLHLPKSAFPARAALPSPYLAKCTDDLYAWQSERTSAEPFVLHDGPPYANGSLHVGHALNKILKDIVCRFQITQGKRVQYTPGWDCHGLPIEIKALQALKVEHDAISPIAIRAAAHQLAERTIKEQMEGFKEWAVLGDWNNAYKTMDPGFEMRQLGIFKQMVEKGSIYRARKPVYWSASSQSALAEAELEYDPDHVSQCAFISYPIAVLPEELSRIPEINEGNLGALIWTTTPWTLPANRAIAVNSEMEYSVVALERSPRSQFIVASSRLDYLKTIIPHDNIRVIADSIKGSVMADHMVYREPLQGQLRPIIHADFVSDSSGSGLVHLAPGHGMDDYILCQRRGIDAFAPVDDQGRFTADALPAPNHALQGKKAQTEGNAAVLDLLRSSFEDRQPVIATHEITHKYPVDWRTKQPVMVRATEQWFADIEGIKKDALEALEKVQFVPGNAKTRLESFIKGRTQWCISRQRAWGVPIPALYRVDKEPVEAIMTGATIEHIMSVIKKRGIDAWWTDTDNDPAWIPLGLNGRYIRGKDTMDVWFDSGTSWSLLPSSPRRPVADVYLEGSDQHRGWFQSSLLTHIACQQSSGATTNSKRAPFGTLITHGFTLDQDGRKMSKSLGNVVSPSDIMTGTLLPPIKSKKKKGQSNPTLIQPKYDAMGPDALRLWVAGSDYTKDVVIGQPVLQGVQQSLHKLRVTFKWLLGALSDFDPEIEPRILQTNGLLDRIALRKLSLVSENIHSSYASYDFSKAVMALNKYISHDLSAFYFETVKDRLYTGAKTERVSAQGTLYHIFNELLAMLAPITPLMVEEVWDFVPPRIKGSSQHPLQRIWAPFTTPATHAGPESAEELDLMLSYILAANTSIKLAQETARTKKLIGSGLESDVHLRFEPTSSELPSVAARLFSAANCEMLAAAFVVSKVVIDAGVTPNVTGSSTPEYDGQVGKEVFHLTWQREDGEELTQSGVAYIVRPSGQKCGRCWRYLHVNQDGLCGRCDDVIKQEWPAKLS